MERKERRSSNSTIKIKLAIAGDVFTGKSTLTYCFKCEKMLDASAPTIGFDFASKMVEIDDTDVKVCLYDMSGSETFKTITKNYFRIVDGVIIVYDVTNRESFRNIEEWLKVLRNSRSDEYSLIIIGNKIDLSDQRNVSTEEGERMAERCHLPRMQR